MLEEAGEKNFTLPDFSLFFFPAKPYRHAKGVCFQLEDKRNFIVFITFSMPSIAFIYKGF